tara:strand:- start:1482 stop:2267 length:786 start_codon:yes stop_codon:yes gene_type:complete
MTSQSIHNKDDTLAVVTRYHQAWRERNLEGILCCYHNDIHYHDFFQNKVFTQTDIKQYIAQGLSSAEIEHLAPIRADGDTAFIEYRIRLQGDKGAASFRASEAITVQDGLIIRIHEYATLVAKQSEKTVKNHSLARLGLSTRQVASMSEDVRKFIQQPSVLTQAELNLQHVADATGYSRNQLSFLFNQVFGARFLQTINEQRIAWVLEQLQSNIPATMDQLAFAAGFNSVSVFYKYFRQVTGKSPKAYINALGSLSARARS